MANEETSWEQKCEDLEWAIGEAIPKYKGNIIKKVDGEEEQEKYRKSLKIEVIKGGEEVEIIKQAEQYLSKVLSDKTVFMELCPCCHGQAVIPRTICPECEGLCYVYEGDEKVQCPICEGMGSLQESVCPVCIGGLLINEDKIFTSPLYPNDERILSFIDAEAQKEIRKANLAGRQMSEFEASNQVMNQAYGDIAYKLLNGGKPVLKALKVQKADGDSFESDRDKIRRTIQVLRTIESEEVAEMVRKLKKMLRSPVSASKAELQGQIAQAEGIAEDAREEIAFIKKHGEADWLTKQAESIAKADDIPFDEALVKLLNEDSEARKAYNRYNQKIAKGE